MDELRECKPADALMQLSRTCASCTTAWRDGDGAPDENITLDVQELSPLDSVLPSTPSTLRRDRCGPWSRCVLDSNMLDHEPLPTSPRNALRRVVSILTELGSKDERDSDVDKASRHAVSEFCVEDVGFLLDSSRELFVPRQAFSSFISETSTPSITPRMPNERRFTDFESDKRTNTSTPPLTPRAACWSLAMEGRAWDTTNRRTVGCVGGQRCRQRKFTR